jgi:RNA polymerase sigma factor (sigma-70 family)
VRETLPFVARESLEPVIAAAAAASFRSRREAVVSSSAIREPTCVSPDAAQATRALYERHGQRVFSFCLSRLRDWEEAQDAAQTAFVYVLKALDRGVVPRYEVAWLLKIAENVCRTSHRSLGRRRAVISSADVTELEVAAASLGGETDEELAELRSGLEQLPASQRRAILLREWQGLTYADIADDLDLSVSAVETLLFRARRGLAAYRDRARRAVGALNVGSLVFAARSALQSSMATTAAAGALVVAASPMLVRGDVTHPARSAAEPAAWALHHAPSSAGGRTHAAPTSRGRGFARPIRASEGGSAKHSGAPSSRASGKAAPPPPTAARRQAPVAPSGGEAERVTGAVRKIVEPPPVELPPLPPLPPAPPLPPPSLPVALPPVQLP